jgi:hypothetical protein
LTNIRPVVPPAGRVKDEIIDRLTGTYTALQIARISQTFYDLLETGILDLLDGLYIRGLNEDDSLINWVTGQPDAINYGATYGASGFTSDGVDDWISMEFSPVKSLTNRMTLFVFTQAVTLGTSAFVLGGSSLSASSLTNARLTFSTTNVISRLSSTTSMSTPYTGDRSGLWTIHRGGNFLTLRRNGVTLETEEIPFVDDFPNNLSVFREGNTYAAHTVSAFGYGDILSQDQATRLSQILSDHHRTI